MKRIAKPLLLALLGWTLAWAPPASCQTEGRVVVTVDATRTLGRLEPFWASQIVHPTEALLTDWGRHFLGMLKETGAAQQYVRIYNQPEAAVRVGADGAVAYDWSQFDEMAALILKSGNKPKVVFFGMPSQLAAYPEAVLKRPNGAKVCISPPKDYRQWEALCADFARHVVDTYGIAEVKQWTFRCWNEPDLGGFWRKGDLDAYFKLYDHFAKGMKGVNAELRIGGPALSSTKTYQEPKNVRRFLEHVTAGTNAATGHVGAPIDFLAIHTYGGSGGGGGPGQKYPSVEYLLEQQVRYADMRDEYPSLRGLPIHVEEWGESSGGTTGVDKKPSADIRNSQYGAAFLVSWVERHIRMRQEKDRHFASFTFCASGYEKPPKRDFMGYRTLDTKSGFHKPILNAYQALSKLGHTLVPVDVAPQGGRVTAFAACDSNRVTVVVTHFQHDRIDNNGAACPVQVRLSPPWHRGAKMTLRHWRIDGSHSNAYAAFQAIGAPESPTLAEVDAVKKRMGLELMEPARPISDANVSELSFDLPCNAVSLLEVVVDAE